MCASCEQWVRERRDPLWAPKKIKTSIRTMRQVPVWRGSFRVWVWTI